MEVHAHSHTPRKKWTHYFWEFLMLFLAVFCGFLAENIREHQIEHHRAKLLAVSLYTDFKNDSTGIKDILELRKEWNDILDTLITELQKPVNLRNDTTIFLIAGNYLINRTYFAPTTGTYDQIKQSGYLRYFKQDIGFNLVQCESNRNLLALQLDMENKFVLESIVPLVNKNLNNKFLNALSPDDFGSTKEALITKSPAFQNELNGMTRFLQKRSKIYITTLKYLDSLSNTCIDLLKREYHLQ